MHVVEVLYRSVRGLRKRKGGEPGRVAVLVATVHERSRSSERVRNWALATFLCYTGLRVSELHSMRLAHIPYEKGWPACLKIVGKGDKERTVVRSHDPAIGAGEAAHALSVWLQRRAVIILAMPGPPIERVWLVPVGARAGQLISPAGAERSSARHLVQWACQSIRPSFVTPSLRLPFGMAAV